MEFKIPQPLKDEHESLHSTLVRATRAPGATGEAARAVAAVLHPHFVKEEQFALPPLGLLAPLLDRKERALLVVDEDSDDNLVEELRAALDNVEVAVRHGVEGAGVDGASHTGFGK